MALKKKKKKSNGKISELKRSQAFILLRRGKKILINISLCYILYLGQNLQ